MEEIILSEADSIAIDSEIVGIISNEISEKTSRPNATSLLSKVNLA